ncbi:MAG: signal peptide peptidase SppA [Myxococcales bacterium]
MRVLRAARLLPLCLLLVTPEALAQTTSVGGRTVAEGLHLPPTSAATIDDAESAVVNVAGLGFMHGLQLEYLHDREQAGPDVVGDGVYFAGTLFDVFALGLSFEWIRPAAGADWPSYRKTQLSAAWSPSRALSFGLAFEVYNSPEAYLDGMTSWDAGVMFRPWSWFSAGLSVRDFDTPSVGAAVQPRRYDLGLAFRPFHQRLTLAADYVFDGEQEVDALAEGPGNGQVGLTVQLELFEGLGLLLGGALPVNPHTAAAAFAPTSPMLQAGLTLDTEHFGAVAAVGAQTNAISGSRGDLVAGARLSLENFPALPVPFARIAVVDLDAALAPPSSGLLRLFAGPTVDPFENLLDQLDDASRDPTLAGVLLRYGSLDLGLAKVEELRDAMKRLRARGKRVAVLLEGGGDREYYLATAAERIYGLAQADYFLKGFSTTSIFLGEGLEKLGVRVDVVRVGPYKDAPDILTRSSPSPQEEETTRALLDEGMTHYLDAVAAARHVPGDRLLSILDRGLTSAQQAHDDGLLDGVLYPDELGKTLHALLGRPVSLEGDWLGRPTHEPRWGSPEKIALVDVRGLITGGRSSSGAGLGETAGAATIADALREASCDSEVAAIVLRVDSGGGDVEASELIWRAVEQAKKKKPVVVSFGDVAASGGYYVGVAGDEILAEPDTVTGSIGVFALKPDLEGLLGKVGVHTFVDKTARNGDLFNLTRRWSQSEIEVIQKEVDASYETFLARVAAGRKLSRADVDAVGRGRVWSGSQALARHLVDGVGSLLDAVDHAKRRAKLSPEEPVDLVVYGAPQPLLSLGLLSGQTAELSKLAAWLPGVAPLLALDPGRPLALPEAEIRVR